VYAVADNVYCESDMSKGCFMKIREVVIMKKVNDILREKLEGQNISALAKEVGVSRSLLHDWIAARRLPSLKNISALKKLATHVGMSLDQLLTGQEEDKKIITSLTFSDNQRKYKIIIERLM